MFKLFNLLKSRLYCAKNQKKNQWFLLTMISDRDRHVNVKKTLV